MTEKPVFAKLIENVERVIFGKREAGKHWNNAEHRTAGSPLEEPDG